MILVISLNVNQKQGSCSKQDVETIKSTELSSKGNFSPGGITISTDGSFSISTHTNFIPFVSKKLRKEPFTFRPPISITKPLEIPYAYENANPDFNAV